MSLKVVPIVVGERTLALPVENVERLLGVCEILSLPKPVLPGLLGIVEIAGQVMPVVSLRYLLGYSEREPELDDQLLVLSRKNEKDTGEESICLLVEGSETVLEIDEADANLLLENELEEDYTSYVFRSNSGELVAILNPSALFSLSSMVPREVLRNE